MVELKFLSPNITPAMTNYEGAIFLLAAIVIIFATRPVELSFTNTQTG
jgi:hypothetical protein